MYFIDGQVFFRVQLFKSWIASVIHPINYYPDWINILAKPICPIHWIAIYQVDSIIHLSNNWAQDNYLLFTSNSKIFFWIIEYACINTQKSRALIREKLHHCQRTKTWWTWRVSFQPSLKKTACSSQDWLAEMTFVMMSLPSRWLAEIWCMIAQLTGSHGELEAEFKFQRCSCEALLPFPALPLEHPAELTLRLTG